MTRTAEERAADVRRLLAGARAVAADAARLAPLLAESTGLSRAGVEHALRTSLETSAEGSDLAKLVAAAGDAKAVHVVLSANVFTAPLRALAIARAAAERVTVRPSSREPVFTRALVEATADPAIAVVDELDASQVEDGEIHVYGRDETIAELRARARVPVRGHGAGMGVAVVSPGADLAVAASELSLAVAAFDQRGCLSPRVAFVEGDDARAAAFAAALHRALADVHFARGALYPEERADATRWRQAVEFAGSVLPGVGHVVGVAPGDAPLAVPPPGRHVLVVPLRDPPALASALSPIARVLVAAGATDVARYARHLPLHARLSSIAAMQSPPLDGPVDLRAHSCCGAE